MPGVSARSVHNHFADVEALRSEVAQRQWDRNLHRGIPRFGELGSAGAGRDVADRVPRDLTRR